MTHEFTMQVADARFGLTAEQGRAVRAALRDGSAPAMILGCRRCGTICFRTYSEPVTDLSCACHVAFVQLQRRSRPGAGRARPDDLGDHVRAPVALALATVTRTNTTATPAAMSAAITGEGSR